MPATRWACLSAGKIASDFFLAVQQNLPSDEHEFVAVAARDLTRAQAFADKYKFKKAYGSYDEVAKDEDVEIVYIATLNPTHVDLSIKMLEAGKHVLCEKPMAMNLESVNRVLDLAKSRNLVFWEATWSRWFPSYSHIRKEIDAGSLGDVRLVEAKFCMQIAEVDRIKNSALGGGGLLDIGVYVIQFACFVYREMPESITAVGNVTETGVDANACVILKYKSGAMATLTYHTDAGNGDNAAVIMGKKGRIQVEAPFWAPTRIHTPSGTVDFPLKGGAYNFGNSAGLQFEAAAVRDCILNGQLESDCYSHEDVKMVHAILAEVRRQIGGM